MKIIITTVMLAFAYLSTGATSLHDQLCAFNINWKKYYMQAPREGAMNFSCDRELIQTHLGSVLAILRSAPTAHLSTEQFSSRTNMIALLDDYRLAGTFPMNYYRAERIPVFIDEHGTHCAVGYLMMMTGHEEMAQRIARADNYVWVKDLRDVGVPAWQEACGLSFEELALIQGAYDFYPMNGYFLADRYETPQQPKCTTAYFENNDAIKFKAKNVWCTGEGKNGILNGKWTQNYSEEYPWIEGYYQDGKRTGEWKEYYQGTNILCRTERWFNDKLNGTRVRYDRSGHVIEEILFSQGNAVSKINYDLNDSLAYVRIPEDSTRVLTQVYNWSGQLIACGHEIVYNPSGLLWFQSIELTALNSAQISTRSQVQFGNVNNGGLNATGGYYANQFQQPSLVEYKKEGDWIYLRDTAEHSAYYEPRVNTTQLIFANQYNHFGDDIGAATAMFNIEQPASGYDSMRVTYSNNNIVEFMGYHPVNFVHLHLGYHDMQYINWTPWFPQSHTYSYSTVKEMGQYNALGQRIGEWKYYTASGVLCKTENYLIPMKEEETVNTMVQLQHQ